MDEPVWSVFAKEFYGKVFTYRGYIKQGLFDTLFDESVHLVHGLKTKTWAYMTKMCLF